MNKELEAFYKIKAKLIKTEGNTTYGSIIDLTNLDTIETALKRLERIDNQPFINGIKEIVPADKISKQLKALETIKEIMSIEEEDFFYDKETDTYFFVGFKVSKEQYDLLRKVLLHYGKE